MNILIVDAIGAALDFAIHCQMAGHKVKWFIRKNDEGKVSQIGDGYVTKVPDYKPWIEWADLVFLTDNTHFLKELDSYRKKGYPIFGPSYLGGQLELDRQHGQDVLKDHGIKIISSETFSNYNKAEKYVTENMKRYVSKPSGDADKALSYVSKSPADMVFMLRRWKELNKIKSPFILQEFVPGIEVAVGGWIGPNGFSQYFCENFEHKKLMNNELGPNTGEMGTAVAYRSKSKLADVLLKPLEQYLVDIGMTGYVDVAAIMDEEGELRPLEFTTRPGWPTFSIQSSLHEGDPAQWMVDLIEGRDTLECTDEIALGVVMAIPDFPYSHLTKKELTGYPVYHTDKVDEKLLHFCEVMKGKAPAMDGDEIVEKDLPVSAGDYILVATGLSDTVRKAKIIAYKNMKQIEMPNSAFYRTDIGDRLEEDLEDLQEHGYCLDWVFE